MRERPTLQRAKNGHLPPLIVVAPIEPRTTGNGLAMRVGSICQAATHLFEPTVAVFPIAGRMPATARIPGLEVKVFETRGADGDAVSSAVAAKQLADLLRPSPGTPVLAIRSYVAPVALALGEAIGSKWVAADLDDDDEAFLNSSGDADGAMRVHELLKATAPRISALSAASAPEAERISRRHGVEVLTIANTVAVPAVRPPHRSGQPTVLFVGNLTYQPNIDAVVRLICEVLPVLRRSTLRQISATVVGPYNPSGPLGAFDECDGVTLAGFVEDLRMYYRRAGVMVAPIGVAGGTRIKLLEAFAAGVPVVTTEAGAAGLDVRHGEHLLIGGDPARLGVLAAGILDDPELAERISSNAFRFVRECHAPAVAESQVAELVVKAENVGRPRW